jgi:CHASE2 domain-containing sensor protein
MHRLKDILLILALWIPIIAILAGLIWLAAWLIRWTQKEHHRRHDRGSVVLNIN